MLLLKYLFVLLHIITAAAWFGLSLPLARQARSARQADATAAAALVDTGARAVSLMNVFVVLTFVFALGAFFSGGGFAVYGPPYHSAITFMLLLLGVQFFLIRTGWNRLTTGIAGDSVVAEKGQRFITWGIRAGHVL